MKKLFALLLIPLLTLAACGPGETLTPAPPAEEATPLPPPTEGPTAASPLPTAESPLPPPEPAERGGVVLLIIAPEDFRDEEYTEPRAAFEAAGYTVVVASLSLDVATGMLGTQVRPNLTLADVQVADYAAVVFIGGNGAVIYWDAPQAHRVAREAVEQGKVVGAICIAPVILARAGVLEGKEATVFDPEGLCAELEASGAICTTAPVHRDGRIITANGPQAATPFAEAIIKALGEP